MYLSSALKSLTCGASLGLLSLLVMAWVPRPVVLILFGSGVLLMAFGWVITLFICINEFMDLDVVSLERQ
jgi:O-antigen/teichoic acid export membrane protein